MSSTPEQALLVYRDGIIRIFPDNKTGLSQAAEYAITFGVAIQRVNHGEDIQLNGHEQG